MRMIGNLPNRGMAERFGDYLTSRGIENHVIPEEDTRFGIWIYSEDQMEAAGKLLQEFSRDPERPDYENARSIAQVLKFQKKKAENQAQKNFVDLRTHWHRYDTRIGPVSLTLIIISVVLTLIMKWSDIFFAGRAGFPRSCKVRCGACSPRSSFMRGCFIFSSTCSG
jgi:hypothetical protein